MSKRAQVRSAVRREPVVVNAVKAVVALLAAFNVDVSSDVVQTAIEVGSVAFAAWSVWQARSKVTPVS